MLVVAQGETQIAAVTQAPIPSADSSAPAHDTYHPLPEKVQLVACVGNDGTGPLLATCRYGGDYKRYWNQGKYRVTVYEVKSGRKVGTTRISGIDHHKCEPSQVFFDWEAQTDWILTEPTRAEFRKLLAPWAEANH
ncbi:hypothetical protein [Streptomyces sp. NPDC048411]|uniref:hypothetical protein n=1 Tax=Streptomyces sp. NPDC048411 TaxID=3157206 RepID=UPI0034560C11